MSRAALLDLLRAHRPWDERERGMLDRMIAFVDAHEDCCERSLLVGHITASAWIVDRERSAALLTHHRKLDKWLQPGGHTDGDTDVLRSALREAREETGLSEVRIVSPAVFDVDIHEIPERKQEPRHFHYDVRFLFEADRDAPLTLSDESHELAWVALADLDRWNTDESVLRLRAKTPARGQQS